MSIYKLKNIDREDIEDLLAKVENSFGIRFVGNELVHIATFGQLCDHIISKLRLDNTTDCTNQQAFYKIRAALASILNIGKETILLDSRLSELLPKKIRRSVIHEVEATLGLKLDVLRASSLVTGIATTLIFVSLSGFFISWSIGLLGMVTSAIVFWVTRQTGKEFRLETVRQVVEKMAREHYLKSRRNRKTVNKKEVEIILTKWFVEDLELDRDDFSRDTKLI